MKNSDLPQPPRLNRGGLLGRVLLAMTALAFGCLALPSSYGVQPTVSISAVTTSVPATAGSTNVISITRNTTGPLTVYLLIAGTAGLGTDYTVNTSTQSGDPVYTFAGGAFVSFSNNTLTETISITPQNPVLSPSASMAWTLYYASGYTIVNSQATVTLAAVPPATVSFASINGVSSFSETATNVPAFAQVVRSAATAQPLTVYLVNTTNAAKLGSDYTCAALTPVTGFVGIYAVTIPANQTTVQLTATPVADWIPEGGQAFGYTLLTQANPAWQNLSPQPQYPSPTNVSEVQVNVTDVNINASMTLTNPTTTQGQTSNPPTLTFSRDITPISSTIYFSLTSSQSGNLNQQVQVNGATLVSGSTYAVQINGTATSAAVQLLPKNGTGAGFATTITAQILGSTDAGVGSLVRYAVASPSSQTVSILNTYPTVSLQVLQPIVYQNGQTLNVIAVNRTSQGLANPLTVSLTQSASQARVVYDYYLFDNLGNNISNPAQFTLTFPAGVSQILIGMQGVANGQVEPNQLVAWQLASSSSYAPSPGQANILLISTTVQVSNPGANALFTLDFEHGMQGATSQYFVAPLTNPVYYTLYPEGDYLIGSNPITYHNLFNSLFDHTFGTASGHMMIVNGAPTAGTLLLGFTLHGLTPSKSYYVNYYGTSVNPASPALMQVAVNGQTVGQAHFESAPGWHQYTYVFTTDASGNATIEFLNLNTERSGNDFALDDITVGTYTTKTNLPGVDISQTPSTILEYTPPSGTGPVKVFTVTRDRDSTPTTPERIYLTQTSPALAQAVYGVDYTSSQLQFDSANNVYYVDLPPGQIALDVYITPVDNWIPGPDTAFGYRLLTFTDPAWGTLQPFYYPSNGSPVQVTIQNVSINATITAITPNLFENQPSPSQVFAINRDLGGPVACRVYFALSAASTAKLGTNFTWTGASQDSVTGLFYVTFAAGQTQALISIQPTAMNVIGPDLTITPQIVDGSDSRLVNNQGVLYRAGNPSSATAYLHQTSSVVNLSVITPTVTQGQGSTAVLQIKGPTTGVLRVYLALASATTATYPGAFTTSDLQYDPASGYFYTDINFSVTPTKTISITPDDWVALPSRTLAWTLVSPAALQAHGFAPAYQLGANTSGNVTILPNSVVVTLPQGLANLPRNTQGNTTIATVSRSRTGQAQTVYLQVSGTAVNGTDYTFNGLVAAGNVIPVVFGVNTLSVPISITTIDNWQIENNPTLGLQVVPDSTAAGTIATYTVGSPSASSVILTDVANAVSIVSTTASMNRDDPPTKVFVITRGRTGKAQSVWFKAGSGANPPAIIYYPGVPATALNPYDLKVDSDPVLADSTGFLVNFGTNASTATIWATPYLYYGCPTSAESYALTLIAPPSPSMYTLSKSITASVNLAGYTPPTVSVSSGTGTGSGMPPGSFNLICSTSGPLPDVAITLTFTLSGVAPSRYTVAYAGVALSGTVNANTETLSLVLNPADFGTGGGAAKVINIYPLQTLSNPGSQTLTLTLQPSSSYTFPNQNPKYPLLNPPTASIGFTDDGELPSGVQITAVIVSGASSNPWALVDPGQSTGVTVKGGLVALGNPQASGTPLPTPPPGSVKLVSDPNLLDGKYVPPIVPTVMDARISQITSSTINSPVTSTGWLAPAPTPGAMVTPTPVGPTPTPGPTVAPPASTPVPTATPKGKKPKKPKGGDDQGDNNQGD